jgi:hypothetical protein
MRQNTLIAVIFSLMLSSCATYQGADGQTHVADPSACSTGICELLIIGVLAGIGAAVASHR